MNRYYVRKQLDELMEHFQEVGALIGSPDECSFVNDEFRDEYAKVETELENVITKFHEEYE